MPIRFLNDIALADIAVEIEEPTVEALFARAAEALVNIQIEDTRPMQRSIRRNVTVSHPQIDLLLYRFLQELIFLKDAKRLMLLADRVAIERTDAYHLTAVMSGETVDPARHDQRVDVKAVTFHRFEVVQSPAGWK